MMSHAVTSHGVQHARNRPRDTRPPSAPDPAELAALVARVFLEVEMGCRPLSQLRGLLAPALYARLRRCARTAPRRSGPIRVLRTTVSLAGPDTCDAAIVVRRGSRAGSLALRLERLSGAWQVVELARPEDHGTIYRPPPLIVRR